VCDQHPSLVGGLIERPDWRPVTRYELKGIDAGRDSVDLLYRRTA
jgi:tRNA (guanine-N7-)-methyltransferase